MKWIRKLDKTKWKKKASNGNWIRVSLKTRTHAERKKEKLECIENEKNKSRQQVLKRLLFNPLRAFVHFFITSERESSFRQSSASFYIAEHERKQLSWVALDFKRKKGFSAFHPDRLIPFTHKTSCETKNWDVVNQFFPIDSALFLICFSHVETFPSKL